MEPIQGNGGRINFPPDYYPAIRELCDDLGMLLIFDEIQTGFRCCHAWFAAELNNTVSAASYITNRNTTDWATSSKSNRRS